MNLERIFELENKEFTDRLIKNAVFKGGGGGGGQNTQTVQKADPWSGQQPFLTDVFQQAQNRYNAASPNFFPNSTVQGFDPLESNYQNQVTDYVQSGRPQQMQMGAENAINNELFNSPNNAMFQATRGLAPYAQQGLNNASGFTGQQALHDSISYSEELFVNHAASADHFIDYAEALVDLIGPTRFHNFSAKLITQ